MKRCVRRFCISSILPTSSHFAVHSASTVNRQVLLLWAASKLVPGQVNELSFLLQHSPPCALRSSPRPLPLWCPHLHYKLIIFSHILYATKVMFRIE